MIGVPTLSPSKWGFPVQLTLTSSLLHWRWTVQSRPVCCSSWCVWSVGWCVWVVLSRSYFLFLNHVSIRTVRLILPVHPQNPLFSSVTTNSNCTIINELPVVVDDDPASFSQIAREVVEQQRTVDYYMHAYNREHEYHPEWTFTVCFSRKDGLVSREVVILLHYFLVTTTTGKGWEGHDVLNWNRFALCFLITDNSIAWTTIPFINHHFMSQWIKKKKPAVCT